MVDIVIISGAVAIVVVTIGLALYVYRTVSQADHFVKLRLGGVSSEEAQRISGLKLPRDEE